MDGLASCDGYDGSRWDGHGNGWLGVAMDLVMDGSDRSDGLGNGRLAMDWMAPDGTARQWTAPHRGWMAIDGSALRDGLDVSRWDGLGNGWLGVA